MAKSKGPRIDIGFNLFAYAALSGKNLEKLDEIIREKIGTKNPYSLLVGSSRLRLESYGRVLAPVAKAVGITKSTLMQPQIETVLDLSRKIKPLDTEQKQIIANITFDEDGYGLGKVVCYFEGKPKIKMALVFYLDTSRKKNKQICKAIARFALGDRVLELVLKANGMQDCFIGLIRQFAHIDKLETGFSIFNGGQERIAEYLVDRYRDLGFSWHHEDASQPSGIRKVAFAEEEYVVKFDDGEQLATVASLWCKRFRFNAKCPYTDYMELDLATICDLDGYEDAVYERDKQQEELEQLELKMNEIENTLREIERRATEIARKCEEAKMQEIISSTPNRVVDLSGVRPQERPIERVHIADLVVKTRISTCRYEHHEIHEVIALVNVFDPHTGVVEVAVDAFCCPTCERYYVLEENFDKLAKRGSLCCRVIVRSGQVQEFIPSNHKELAEKSFFKQLGYSVAKEEGLSDKERRAILDFAIENGFKTQKQTISFLEWLIRFNGSQKNMRDAVKKWEDDVRYLISSRGSKSNPVKIDRVFLTKHKW